MKAIPELVIAVKAIPGLVEPFGDCAKTLRPPVSPYCFGTRCNSTLEDPPHLPHQAKTFEGQRRDYQDYIRKIRSGRRQ